jgi:hypothetical protein
VRKSHAPLLLRWGRPLYERQSLVCWGELGLALVRPPIPAGTALERLCGLQKLSKHRGQEAVPPLLANISTTPRSVRNRSVALHEPARGGVLPGPLAPACGFPKSRGHRPCQPGSPTRHHAIPPNGCALPDSLSRSISITRNHSGTEMDRWAPRCIRRGAASVHRHHPTVLPVDRRSIVAGRTHRLHPCRRCRKADRRQPGMGALSAYVGGKGGNHSACNHRFDKGQLLPFVLG